MVTLVFGIFTSVAVEFVQNGMACLQGSISAYYYTPARAFFVSAVLALGVCLVALRGTTPWEETWLNYAGMLAPVVALVPTPNPGDCTSDPALTHAGAAAVSNNMIALLCLAPACLVYVGWLRRRATQKGSSGRTRRFVRMILLPAALWLAAVVLFVFRRTWFIDHGHAVAAVAMFACIVAVVVLNARGFARKAQQTGWSIGPVEVAVNRYLLIAVLMVISAVVVPIIGWLTSWGHWVFVVEALLLALFLAFWTLQTEELWDETVREGDPASQR